MRERGKEVKQKAKQKGAIPNFFEWLYSNKDVNDDLVYYQIIEIASSSNPSFPLN